MWKNKFIKILVAFFILSCTVVLIRKHITIPNNVEIKVNEIKSSFKGKIIEKYAVRDIRPTHLKVLVANEKVIVITPNQDVVDIANVGDSLIKPANENIIYLKNDKFQRKFFYTRLSFETRMNRHFPKEWRDKWMESSEWDKTNNDEK